MMNIFVARLDFGVTQEELKKAFEQYGKVNKVSIATDKETGKAKGFAFVEMFNENEANEAIKGLDGFSFNGRQIAVKQAEDRNSNRRDNNSDRKPFNKDFSRNNQGGDRQAQTNSERTYKTDNNDSSKSDPVFQPPINNSAPKTAPKKKENHSKKLEDRPKAQKMTAYKKSGKQQRFFYDDEDDMY
jgi:RNA recognition motif-containing protein